MLLLLACCSPTGLHPIALNLLRIFTCSVQVADFSMHLFNIVFVELARGVF